MKLKIASIISVLCISTLANAIAPGGSRDEVAVNVAYQNCGTYLYDQDDVIASQAFISASDDQKNQMLESEFYRKRRICYGWELGKSVASLAPMLFAFYKLYGKIGGNGLGGNAAVGIGGTLMFYQIFNTVLSDFMSFMTHRIDTLKSFVTNVVMPTNNDQTEKVELRYVREKRHLQKDFIEIIEPTLIAARSKKDPFSNDMTQGSARDKTPMKFVETLLDLPTQNKEVVYDPARIEKYLGTYAPEIARQFKLFAVRHAAASENKVMKKTKMVVYLKGLPGVGKTRAAKNLAEAMESPFFVIKLGGKSVKDLEGDASHPGLLLEAIMKAKWAGKNAANPVIFFDEIDRALGMTPKKGAGRSPMGMTDSGGSSFGEASAASTMLPFLLTVLEPGTDTFYFPYLGAELDISNLGVILAGNFDLTDEAFKNRCEIVEMPAYTPEFKWNVTDKMLFDEQILPFENSKKSISRADFDDEDWKYIEAVVKADEDPGFRTVIRELQKFMGDKVLCKHYNDCERKVFPKPKVEKPVIRFDEMDEAYIVPEDLEALPVETVAPAAQSPGSLLLE